MTPNPTPEPPQGEVVEPSPEYRPEFLCNKFPASMFGAEPPAESLAQDRAEVLALAHTEFGRQPAQALTDEELRVRVARFCGVELPKRWKFRLTAGVDHWSIDHRSFTAAETERERIQPYCPDAVEESIEYVETHHLPDYLGSLDAIASAEAKLTDKQWWAWGRAILDIGCPQWRRAYQDPSELTLVEVATIGAQLTARERAQALLQTIEEKEQRQ